MNTSVDLIDSAKKLLQLEEGVTLLPSAIARRAGLRQGPFERLEMKRSNVLSDEVLDREHEFNLVTTDMIAALERSGDQGPVHNQAHISQLQQDLKTGALHRCASRLTHLLPRLQGNPDLCAALSSWSDLYWKLQELLREGDQTFRADLETSRRYRYVVVFRSTAFRKALALSSIDLSRSLEEFISGRMPSKSSRWRRFELGVARYYSRGAYKISPFSSFMTTDLLTFKSRDEDLHERRETYRIVRDVKVNRSLIRQIAIRLVTLSDGEELARVRLSHLALPGTKQLLVLQRAYYAAQPSRMLVPYEKVAIIPLPSGLSFVAKVLNPEQGQMTLKELCTLGATTGIPYERAKAYILLLKRLGLLCLDIPFYGTESSGLVDLSRWLASTGINPLEPVQAFLSYALYTEQSFGKASALQRLDTLRNMGRYTHEVLASKEPSKTDDWRGHLVYENCVCKPLIRASLPKELIGPGRDLCRFLRAVMMLLDGNVSTRQTLVHILNQILRKRAAPFFEVLNTYQSFVPRQADIKKGEHTRNPAKLQQLDLLSQLREELATFVAVPQASGSLDLKEFLAISRLQQRCESLLLSYPSARSCLTSCYCQPFVRGARSGIVLSSVSPPLGNTIRALGSVPREGRISDLLKSVDNELREKHPHAEVVEMASAFEFNGNLRPTITARTVAYDSSCSSENDHHLADLEICVDCALQLSVRSNKADRPLLIFDGSLLTGPAKPLGQHILGAICNTDFIFRKKIFHPLLWAKELPSATTVSRFPQIMYGNCVLRRLGWYVPRVLLPNVSNCKGDFELLLSLRRWRLAHNLPEQIFITADSADRTLVESKPEYVDFNIFISLLVLAKRICESTSGLYVEEVLPSLADQRPLGLRRPTEYVVEVLTQF